jgi:twitching motility protein PilT
MQAGQAQGMQTMDVALERLVFAGKISPDAALEKASDKETFRRTLAKRFPEFGAS